jgi:hypothetical protein
MSPTTRTLFSLLIDHEIREGLDQLINLLLGNLSVPQSEGAQGVYGCERGQALQRAAVQIENPKFGQRGQRAQVLHWGVSQVQSLKARLRASRPGKLAGVSRSPSHAAPRDQCLVRRRLFTLAAKLAAHRGSRGWLWALQRLDGIAFSQAQAPACCVVAWWCAGALRTP